MEDNLLCRCGSLLTPRVGTVEHVINEMVIYLRNVPHYRCNTCDRITYDTKVNVFDVLKTAVETGCCDVEFH